MALLDQIITAESGGNPNATNPRSSATGLGQFLNSTWLDMIRQHRPDLAEGRSESDILALRQNPELSREMTARYTEANTGHLTRAGFEANPGNTYLAHFAGPSGAVSVLRAPPSTPVAQILGDRVVQANPFLAGMTAGDLIAWSGRRMGATPSAQAAPPMGLPPATPPIMPQRQPQQAQQQQPQQQAPQLAAPPMGGGYQPSPDIPAVPILFPQLRPFGFRPLGRR